MQIIMALPNGSSMHQDTMVSYFEKYTAYEAVLYYQLILKIMLKIKIFGMNKIVIVHDLKMKSYTTFGWRNLFCNY